MLTRRQLLQSAGAAALLAPIPRAGAGEAWPSRPVRIIVPFAAGGFTDVSIRIIGAKMAESLGVPVTIENRPGSNGIVGTVAAAHAPADGYTILWGNSGIFAVNPSLYPKLGYDVLKDFVPLTLVARADLFLAVNADLLKARNLRELRAEIDALPATSRLRSYASVGTGSTHHLAMELLKGRTGMKLTHVPYKGSTPAVQDVIAGHVPMMFSAANPVAPFVKQGRLRVIACARAERSADLPDIPTLAEQGLAGYDVWGWLALALPMGTPTEALGRLHAAYAATINDAPTRRKLTEVGADIMITTPAAAAHFKAEIALWADIIKTANITATD